MHLKTGNKLRIQYGFVHGNLNKHKIPWNEWKKIRILNHNRNKICCLKNIIFTVLSNYSPSILPHLNAAIVSQIVGFGPSGVNVLKATKILSLFQACEGDRPTDSAGQPKKTNYRTTTWLQNYSSICVSVIEKFCICIHPTLSFRLLPSYTTSMIQQQNSARSINYMYTSAYTCDLWGLTKMRLYLQLLDTSRFLFPQNTASAWRDWLR